MFGVGDVIVHASDISDSTLTLKSIKKPKEVANFLLMNVEKEKDRNNVKGKEMFGAGGFRY